MSRGGPTSRVGLDTAALTDFLEHHSEYKVGGSPVRRRRTINGRSVHPDIDARIIRRWKAAPNGTATRKSATRLLAKYGLTLEDFAYWCEVRDISPTIRGSI